MELSSEILSNIIVYSKYARYLEKEKRRETWDEIIERNMNMHLKKFPKLEEEIRENYKYVFEKKVIPSARSLQFAGKPIEISPQRIFNCSAIAINDWNAFPEIMLLLLLGCGVGYSIQQHHVEQLPPIRHPLKRKKRYLIPDSIEGWADAVKVLMKSYFFGRYDIDFDYRDIRSKGSLLVTSGGKAPGPQPLKDCLHNIRKVLDTIEEGEKLTTFDAHEIICYIADAVLSGGIRRASCLAAFSLSDVEMLSCKNGSWWDERPHLSRANNTAVLIRHKVSRDVFDSLWDVIEKNKTGEPGFYFSNDSEYLLNPCGEANLRISSDGCGSFCNLSEINLLAIKDQKELNECAKVGAFLGTLQASYTNFHYLRDGWRKNTEKDSLLGVGLTGLANDIIYKLNLKEAAKCVLEENERVAKLIGISKAARTTVVKPSGTLSLLLGTSAGIHPWYSKFYIRRMRLNKEEPIYKYLKDKIPQLLEDDFEKPVIGAVLSIPIKAPEGSICGKEENSIKFLERVKYVYNNWIKPGHRKGANTHSISCTVSIKDDEWEDVGEWLWENKNFYNCVSVLPFDGGNYVQMPYEECSKEKYEEMMKHLININLSDVNEEENNVDFRGEMACGGNACEIKSL